MNFKTLEQSHDVYAQGFEDLTNGLKDKDYFFIRWLFGSHGITITPYGVEIVECGNELTLEEFRKAVLALAAWVDGKEPSC